MSIFDIADLDEDELEELEELEEVNFDPDCDEADEAATCDEGEGEPLPEPADERQRYPMADYNALINGDWTYGDRLAYGFAAMNGGELS